MHKKNLFPLILGIAALCLVCGCGIFSLYSTRIVGLYQNDGNPGGASVEVFSLADDGSQELVAGGSGQLATNKRGGFIVYLFQSFQNLIIQITQGETVTRSTVTNVQQDRDSSSSMSGPAAAATEALRRSTKTEYAAVTPETDVETDMLLTAVADRKTPPGQIDRYDIEEIIDATLADKIRLNGDIYDCIIRHIHSAWRLSQLLFIDVLQNQNLGEDTVQDAAAKIKAALADIDALRNRYRRKIYIAITSGAGADAIEELLSLQQQDVLKTLAAAGIPPQLYMKARLISELDFERALAAAATDCSFPPDLRYRLVQRALVRRVRENAVQVKSVLAQVFSYNSSTKVDTALATFLSAVKRLTDGQNNRTAIRSAVIAFNLALLDALQKAVDDSTATDGALRAVFNAMLAARPQLEADLNAALSSDDVRTAFEIFYTVIRTTLMSEIPLQAADPPSVKAQKRAIGDLLFVIGT